MKRTRLKELIYSRGLNPCKLSKMLFYSDSMAYSWVNGVCTPPLEVMVRMAEILNVSVEKIKILFGEDEYMTIGHWKAIYDFCTKHGYRSPSVLLEDLKAKGAVDYKTKLMYLPEYTNGEEYDDMIAFLEGALC